MCGDDFLAGEIAYVRPQGPGSLRMKVCFGFLQSKYRFAVRLVQLPKKMLDERAEQKDHRETLNALALVP